MKQLVDERLAEVFKQIRENHEDFNKFVIENAKEQGEIKIILARLEERMINLTPSHNKQGTQ